MYFNGKKSEKLVLTLAGLYLFFLPLPSVVTIREGCLFTAVAVTAVIHIKNGKWEWPPLKVLLAAWVCIALASLISTDDVLRSLSEIKKEIIYPIIAFWLFYSVTRNRKDFIGLSLFVLASTTIVIAESLYTYYYLGSSTWKLAPRGELYGLKAYYGFQMLTTVAICIAISMSAEASRAIKTYAVALIPFCLLGVYFARLRSGYLSVVAMVCVFLAYTITVGKSFARRAVVVACILIMVAAIPTLLAKRELTLTVNPNNIKHSFTQLAQENRLVIWDKAVEAIRLKPALGLGFGNKEVSAFVEGEQKLIYPHNIFLSYGVMTGVGGSAILLVVFAGLLTLFHKRTIRSLCADRSALGINLSGVLFVITFFILNLTADVMTRHTGQLFWAVTGMMLGGARAEGPDTYETEEGRP